jgi:uncharacterized phiE125 gp8 family phage protein
MDTFGLTTVTAPAFEPVTLDEAKAHLRVDATADDALINALIVAAREYCENWTGRSLPRQTFKLTLDTFPATISLPRPPLVSVTHVKYIDTNGTQQTLASTEYRVDATSEPGRITPAYAKSWPSLRGQIADVEVQYVCGYAAGSVPERAKLAMLVLLSEYYENRTPVASRGLDTAHRMLWTLRADL